MLDLDMRREDKDAGLWKLIPDRVRRFEPFGRMRRRHPNVNDDELGPVLADERQQLVRVAGLTDNLEVGPLQEARQTFAQENVVVGDDDPTTSIRGRIDRASTLRASVRPTGPSLSS